MAFFDNLAWTGLVLSSITIAIQFYHFSRMSPYEQAVTTFHRWPHVTFVVSIVWLMSA